jgi:hypothetical protein
MMAGVEGEHPDYRAKSVQDHNQENMMMEKELQLESWIKVIATLSMAQLGEIVSIWALISQATLDPSIEDRISLNLAPTTFIPPPWHVKCN